MRVFKWDEESGNGRDYPPHHTHTHTHTELHHYNHNHHFPTSVTFTESKCRKTGKGPGYLVPELLKASQGSPTELCVPGTVEEVGAEPGVGLGKLLSLL